MTETVTDMVFFLNPLATKSFPCKLGIPTKGSIQKEGVTFVSRNGADASGMWDHVLVLIGSEGCESIHERLNGCTKRNNTRMG